MESIDILESIPRKNIQSLLTDIDIGNKKPVSQSMASSGQTSKDVWSESVNIPKSSYKKGGTYS